MDGFIDESDNIGAHRDKQLNGLNIVCSISFGGSRYIKFKPYKDEWKKLKLTEPSSFEVKLNDGGTLYMFGNTNIYFTHEILSLRKKDNCEFKPRYSATFREIKGTQYHKK